MPPFSKNGLNRHIRRMIFAGVLLFVEYSLLSFLFDFDSFLKKKSLLQVFGYLGTLAPLAMIIVTALIFLVGKQLRFEIVTSLNDVPYKRSIHFWVINIVSYITLLFITDKIFASTAWIVCWVVCLTLTGCSGLFYAMPPRMLVHFIRRIWKILGPGAIVGALAWGAGVYSASLWGVLTKATFTLVHQLVYLLPGTPVVDAENFIIGTTLFSVIISDVCSGSQGIGLMAVFITGYLFIKRKELRFPSALLLLPIALVAVWLANSLRIFALIAIGTAGFGDIAFGGFHAKAGWVLFCALALGIVAICQHFRIFYKDKTPASGKEATANLTSAYLLPFLVAIAASMATGMFSAGEVDSAYPVRIIAAAAVLWIFRTKLRSNNPFSWSWLSVVGGCFVAVVWITFDNILLDGNSGQFPASIGTVAPWYPAVWITFKIIGSCLIIPVIEELAFRGFLLRRLIQKDFEKVSYQQFTWLSFVASSVAFGLMHGDRWIVGTLAGMAYAWLARRRGNLTDAIVAHAASNIVIAGYVLIFGKWALWW